MPQLQEQKEEKKISAKAFKIAVMVALIHTAIVALFLLKNVAGSLQPLAFIDIDIVIFSWVLVEAAGSSASINLFASCWIVYGFLKWFVITYFFVKWYLNSAGSRTFYSTHITNTDTEVSSGKTDKPKP